MSNHTETDMKTYLKEKISADTEKASARIAQGSDPLIERREHLARMGNYRRKQAKLEKLEQPN